jgi:hypothetical protein
MKDEASAVNCFEKLTSGEIAATQEHMLESAQRLAAIHHANTDKLKSYAIMQHAEGSSPGFAQATLQCSGLMFEFAKDGGVGDFTEVRSFIAVSLKNLPSTVYYSRATMELMYAESYHYEFDYETSIEELARFIDKWKSKAPIPTREIATAMIFRGVGLHQLKRDDEAIAIMEQVLTLPLKDSDRWGSIPNLRIHALHWLKTVAERKHSTADVERYENQIREIEGGSQ